ncbi:MAG TPA: PCYCGC motif-containing (lipo)protein [Acidimicrobiales bacterium]|nr:PCYCGC motif-containing (lipo)protein [Acidimicrobiales bacterium]
MTPDQPPQEAEAVAPASHPRRAVVAAVLAGLGLLVAGTAALAVGAGDHGATSPMTATSMLAPAGALDLTSVSPPVAAEYRYAAAHAAEYRQLRCWCGCRKAFGHRSLADCFVRSDGNWEAHGAGCGVCMAEGMTAHRRLDAGDPVPAIATGLDDRFGPPAPDSEVTR